MEEYCENCGAELAELRRMGHALVFSPQFGTVCGDCYDALWHDHQRELHEAGDEFGIINC